MALWKDLAAFSPSIALVCRECFRPDRSRISSITQPKTYPKLQCAMMASADSELGGDALLGAPRAPGLQPVDARARRRALPWMLALAAAACVWRAVPPLPRHPVFAAGFRGVTVRNDASNDPRSVVECFVVSADGTVIDQLSKQWNGARAVRLLAREACAEVLHPAASGWALRPVALPRVPQPRMQLWPNLFGSKVERGDGTGSARVGTPRLVRMRSGDLVCIGGAKMTAKRTRRDASMGCIG